MDTRTNRAGAWLGWLTVPYPTHYPRPKCNYKKRTGFTCKFSLSKSFPHARHSIWFQHRGQAVRNLGFLFRTLSETSSSTMAEVADMPLESSLDRRRERPPERREKSPDDLPPPPPPRRRERDSRERRDERDDRRYHDRNRSPGAVGSSRDRERDYKRRLSPSPPPYRDRGRHSSPRRLSPPPPFKRSRRDDGGYDNRRGSPRWVGFCFVERRFSWI